MQHKLDVETKVERISSFVAGQGASINSHSQEVVELKNSMDSQIAVAAKELQSSRINEIERERTWRGRSRSSCLSNLTYRCQVSVTRSLFLTENGVY